LLAREIQVPSTSTDGSRALNPNELNNAVWRSLLYLLQNPWFERLWVRQKLRLAKPNARLQHGREQLSWSETSTAVGILARTTWSTTLCKIEMQILSSRLSLVYYFARLCNQDQTIEWSIWTLINITELCQCTDSRDRVYALLSMLHHREAKSIVPDYLESPCEVYKATV